MATIIFRGLFLFMFFSLAACGPSQAEMDSTSTQIAANIFATQTAAIPTATQTPNPSKTPTPTLTLTPSNTPTPSLTPTITPAPTRTPLPTRTVAPSPTPLVDPDKITLNLSDLPDGFEIVDPDDLGLNENLSLLQLEPSATFSFVNGDQFEIIFGFTTILKNSLERSQFDLNFTDQESFNEDLVFLFSDMGEAEVETLAGLENIGEKALGAALFIPDEGLHLDMIIFRRDIVGAIVYTLYLDGQEPVITIQEVAQKLDQNFIHALAE